MRVALTVDPYLPVPPTHYGGIERVVDFLARGLAARDHEVTVFAHPESRIEGRLVPYGDPRHFGPIPRAKELWQVGSQLWKIRNDVDVVHSFGRLAALLPVLAVRNLPKVQSYQRGELPVKGIRRALLLSGGSLQFTACATHMYAPKNIPGKWTTVYNGVDLSKYELVDKVAADAPLVFLGRLERFKGVHNAVSIARASGRKLVIAGNVLRSGRDASYFDEEIAPAIDGEEIRYVGPVDDAQKNVLLGAAAALLMPIEWDEPFGIVMVEAMACGTPVIGFARGSVNEIVRDGVNGFVCSDTAQAAAAVARLGCIDRARVRQEAAQRFGADVIVSAYELLYREALNALERE